MLIIIIISIYTLLGGVIQMLIKQRKLNPKKVKIYIKNR